MLIDTMLNVVMLTVEGPVYLNLADIFILVRYLRTMWEGVSGVE